jgi:hypothetical protein
LPSYLLLLAVLVAALPLARPASPPATEQRARPALPAPEAAPITAQPANPPPAVAAPALPDDGLQAFVRDEAHGDGGHTLTIAAQAQNYQADDGSWQLIEARFSREAAGFSSLRNLLQVRAEPGRAALQLTHAAATLAWTPERLVLAYANGALPLATSRGKPGSADGTLRDDGRSLSYPDSWTLPELRDELLVGPGAVEHNVVFADRPSLPASLAASSALTLELSALAWSPLTSRVGASRWLAGSMTRHPREEASG